MLPESERHVKVTVCQLDDTGESIERTWRGLIAHLRVERSDLLLLPEMPFCRNFTRAPEFDPDIWDEAVNAHERWAIRFPELPAAGVFGTRPIDFGNERYDEGFMWSADTGFRGVHAKTQLQCEPGAWECRWYRAELADFSPAPFDIAMVGFLIGRELWATEEARRYRAGAVDILLTPRMSVTPPADAWLAASREAAAGAGAFALSSGRAAAGEPSDGRGWVIAPDGEILVMTSVERPFASATLELHKQL